MIETKIISAFPGTGKSWLFKNYPGLFLDSDSSDFSWTSPGVRNPDFPSNYITHIKQNIGKYKKIFVSSHDVVRKALVENGIPFTLVYRSEKPIQI